MKVTLFSQIRNCQIIFKYNSTRSFIIIIFYISLYFFNDNTCYLSFIQDFDILRGRKVLLLDIISFKIFRCDTILSLEYIALGIILER